MEPRSKRMTLVGVVTSDAMQKTIVVRHERLVQHARYKKYIRRAQKYLAHDEEKKAKVGDVVEIAQTRPLSRRKRWRLVRVLRAAE
ncbi:MAG: 30S ribosomal protein S17 [Planctomycetota bacterium]